MAYYDYEKDYEAFKIFKREMIKKLKKVFPGIESIRERKGKTYNLLLTCKDGSQFRAKIAEDFQAGDTGYFCLESWSRGRASGIITTEADLTVYRVHYPNGTSRDVVVRTNRLRELYKRDKGLQKIGGDAGSESRLHLYTLEQLFEMGKEI